MSAEDSEGDRSLLYSVGCRQPLPRQGLHFLPLKLGKPVNEVGNEGRNVFGAFAPTSTLEARRADTINPTRNVGLATSARVDHVADPLAFLATAAGHPLPHEF